MTHSHNSLFIWITSILIIAGLQLAPVHVSAAPASGNTKQIEQMRNFLGLMQDFIKVVDAVHSMASDPEKAAIHQMHEIEEIHKKRQQPEMAIELFRSILDGTDNQTIRNAAYMRLGDLLKNSGQADKAVQAYEKALRENIRKLR